MHFARHTRQLAASANKMNLFSLLVIRQTGLVSWGRGRDTNKLQLEQGLPGCRAPVSTGYRRACRAKAAPRCWARSETEPAGCCRLWSCPNFSQLKATGEEGDVVGPLPRAEELPGCARLRASLEEQGMSRSSCKSSRGWEASGDRPPRGAPSFCSPAPLHPVPAMGALPLVG